MRKTKAEDQEEALFTLLLVLETTGSPKLYSTKFIHKHFASKEDYVINYASVIPTKS